MGKGSEYRLYYVAFFVIYNIGIGVLWQRAQTLHSGTSPFGLRNSHRSLPSSVHLTFPRIVKDARPLVNFNLAGDFDGTAIKQTCDAVKWIDKRTIICTELIGGIGNIRNAVLDCLRYSIVLGAGFVMPTVRLRGELKPGEENLKNGGLGGLESFFDITSFLEMMSKDCPQMQVYPDMTAYSAIRKQHKLLGQVHAKDIYYLAHDEPLAPVIPGLLNEHRDTFRSDFDTLLARENPGDASDILYQFIWPCYFEWGVFDDSTAFRINFGRLMAFRADAVRLASEAYINLSLPYYGVHLRAEGDITGNPDWTSKELQIRSYINWVLETDLRFLYIAGGSLDTLQPLVELAESKGIRVVHKNTLLSSASLQHLRSLPFDVQALVDYMLLLKSDKFGGVGMSSFSANLAIYRHLLASNDTAYPTDEAGDGYSRLLDVAWAKNFLASVWP